MTRLIDVSACLFVLALIAWALAKAFEVGRVGEPPDPADQEGEL